MNPDRFEIRPATEAEMGQIGELTGYVYAGAFGDGPDNFAATSNRPEWTLCAFDGPTLVASYAAIPFTMRAAGRSMPMAGVSLVGTLPEYRRQGLLRRLTERSFVDMRARGQAVAALWASQAAIYQRYGYSQATTGRQYAIDSVDINLLEPPSADLSVRREDPADAFETLKGLYRAFVAERMLYLHRSRALWQSNALESRPRDGPVQVAVCRNSAAEPLGYVIYTLRSDRVDHPARGQEIVIRDLVWLSVGACRALWAFLARHDLVGRIRWDAAPADDPTPELIAEPRLLNARDAEGVFLRVVDVPTALSARGWSADGEVTFQIPEDDMAPWNEGVWRLVTSGGEASVESHAGTPELTFGVRALASAFSGHRRVAWLANWGLVDGDADAIERADALFATRYAPACPDHF